MFRGLYRHRRDPLGHRVGIETPLDRHETAFAQGAEPGQLPFGKSPRAGFGQLDRRRQAHPAGQHFERFVIADRLRSRAARAPNGV